LERFPDLIADLLRLNVDVIVVGSSAGARAAKNAAATTPIVFVSASDPLGSDLVSSLARPGGNLTSLVVGEEFAAKWVELAKDILPQVASVAALSHTDHPMARRYLGAMEAAARTLGLKLQYSRCVTSPVSTAPCRSWQRRHLAR
jgi:putative ABC transport system substrate-binding protein